MFNIDFSNWTTYIYIALVIVTAFGLFLSYVNYKPQPDFVWNDVQQQDNQIIVVVTLYEKTDINKALYFFQNFDKIQLVNKFPDRVVYKINNDTFTFLTKSPDQVINFFKTYTPIEVVPQDDELSIWIIFEKN